jgi:hypothetical protein
MARAEIDINQVCRESLSMQVMVKGCKRFKIRMFFVMQLLRIAAWIAPFGMEVQQGQGE